MAAMDGKHMTKDQVRSTEEALDLALEALELSSVTVDSFGVQRKTQEAITAIKQARALDKKAENARELGLDYEPAEVLGHNGWGFPIKAAAPVVPDVMTTAEGEHPEYVQGWNDCRQLMLQTRNNRHD